MLGFVMLGFVMGFVTCDLPREVRARLLSARRAVVTLGVTAVTALGGGGYIEVTALGGSGDGPRGSLTELGSGGGDLVLGLT